MISSPAPQSSKKAKRFAFRPGLWIASVLFFIACTPFESQQSGFVYLTKSLALVGILGYAVVLRGARTGTLAFLPFAIVLLLLLVNVTGTWSNRALLAVILIVLGSLLGQARGKRWNNDLDFIVKTFIFGHLAGLLVALFVFFTVGNVLELHGMLFPRDSRAEAFTSFARLSGFHTEPGTYSQWTLMSLFFLALIHGRLQSRMHFVIALSVVATVSLWAMAGFVGFLSAVLVEAIATQGLRKKIKRLLGVLVLSAAAGVAITLISDEIRDSALAFLQIKGSLTTQSGMDKVVASEFFLQEFWNVFLIGRAIDPGFCPSCISPQDASLAMNSAYYFGVIPYTILIGYISLRLVRTWNIGFVVLLGIGLVWKAHFYEPLLWIIIGYILRGPVLPRQRAIYRRMTMTEMPPRDALVVNRNWRYTGAGSG